MTWETATRLIQGDPELSDTDPLYTTQVHDFRTNGGDNGGI